MQQPNKVVFAAVGEHWSDAPEKLQARYALRRAIVAAILALALAGCIVKPALWQAAVAVCERNNGIDYVARGGNAAEVRCNNGALFELTGVWGME